MADINKNKEFLRRLWSLENEERPAFLISYVGPKVKGGRVVLACRVGLHRDIKFARMADYVKKIMRAKKTNRGLFINVDITNGLIDDSWPETDLDEIYRFILR